jgi:EAL domain-containing protein (putative c-di-GMP-specific phosphodiesterase class I)
MDITEDQDDASIVAAIIALARSLSMVTVAEGVETDEQLAFLKGHGCTSYQGFLFSRALPAHEFAELMANATLSGSEPSGMMPPALRQQLALSQ